MEDYPESIPLIPTKLQAPRLVSDLVRRPDLFERLENQLTLVSAPAGYGKTTLVASWLQETPRLPAWLSLDENDNDLLRFLRYMVAAIRTLDPETCKEVYKMTQADYLPPPEHLAALFINDIFELQESIVLVIDDFHLIDTVSVKAFVSALIENQPLNMHLVIITRTDPLLPLARLRASRKMAEIRAPDLRFRDDEAEMFLNQTMGTTVRHETALASNEHTEGWITGLRLIALSASNESELSRILTSSQHHSIAFVNDYLFAEVLSRLPESLRAFLLHISILNRLSAPLCDAVAVAGAKDRRSDAYLNWAKNANVFLVSLDEYNEWYRFHHLFQTFLLKELQAAYSEDEIMELHRRAALWFAERGFIEEAIMHALEAGDIETAADLIEQHSEDLLNSLERHMLQRWLSLLPRENIWQRPRLTLAKAWLLFREFRLSALDETIRVAETALQKNPLTDNESRTVQGQIASLKALNLYNLYQDYEQSVYWAEQALAYLPHTDHGARGLAIGCIGVSQQALGYLDTAVERLESSIYSTADPGSVKIQAFGGLAMVHEAEAQLGPLFSVLSQFLQLASRSDNLNVIAVANRHAGWLAYERNDIDEAEAHYKAVLDCRYQSSFVFVFDATLGLARILLTKGEFWDAQAEIENLRSETLRLENNDLIGNLESFQAFLWLAQCDHRSALRWARTVDPEAIFNSILISEVADLTQARILTEIGIREETEAAADILKRKLHQATQAHFKLREIQIRIHLALAYDKIGRKESALNELEQALVLAQPGGFVRSFTDMGPEILPLLQQLRESCVHPMYLEQIIESFPDSDLITRPQIAQDLAPTLLTPRQTEIFILLRKGFSYQEIAGDLGISINTVKKHISSIYEKLEVSNRQQAIYKTDAIGLFP